MKASKQRARQPLAVERTLSGSILDIGGGGEGIISRVYGQQVTSIDRLQSELDEAPDLCRKIRMDARELAFLNASFDHVTFFYSLMFIAQSDHERVFLEAVRVLKPGGRLHLWDVAFARAHPEPLLVPLLVTCGLGSPLPVTYGIREEGAAQDAAGFVALLSSLGLESIKDTREGDHFHLVFQKTDSDEEGGQP